MQNTLDTTSKSSEGLKIVTEFVILMVVIFVYATYLVTQHPENMIGFVFLAVAALFSFVIFTQQYMAIIFEQSLIERIEKIDVDTLAKIEEGIRNKLLSGKNSNNNLAQLEKELDKHSEDPKGNKKGSKPKKE
jgi:Ca2+/Na+ antiporter